jgi:hypothetical protein
MSPYRKRVVLIVGLSSMLLVLTGCSGGASYGAKIQSIAVVNSTQVSVTVVVTNTSDTTDTPTCSVTVSTNAGTSLGSNSGPLSSAIKPGEKQTFVLPIDIKAGSAENMSQDASTVACA